MKTPRYHRIFRKHYQQRVASNLKLDKQFHARVKLFLDGVREAPLDDHALTGDLRGRRAFSITGDCRVVYFESESDLVFLDIGTHNQVY